MRDAITSLIGTYDVAGRYFDRNAIDTLKSYFETGTSRIQAAAAINGNAAAIVKRAGSQLFENLPELNLDDINENSVGTYTPTELINEFSKNSKEKDLFKSLNLKNRNSLRVIPGFGDVNIPTKYHKGHIFLNLNKCQKYPRSQLTLRGFFVVKIMSIYTLK